MENIVISQACSFLMKFRPDESYLVTGGYGGLALLTANDRGAGQVALLGSLIPDSANTQIAAIEAAGCKVLKLKCYIGKEAYMLAVLKAVADSGLSLRGVQYAAGFLSDALIAEQSWEKFEKVLAPKLTGGWLLHKHTQLSPLDFVFVLFSSASAIIGNL